jgi:hypothetical protein
VRRPAATHLACLSGSGDSSLGCFRAAKDCRIIYYTIGTTLADASRHQEETDMRHRPRALAPRARGLALALLVAAQGCSGVPITSPRYRAVQEPGEFVVGAVTLPLAFVVDLIAFSVFAGADTGFLSFSVTCLNPFCNAFGGNLSEVPFLKDGVRITRASVDLEVDAPPAAVRAAALRFLAAERYAIDAACHEPGRLQTEWRRTKDERDRTIYERVRVHTAAVAGRTRVRLKLELAGSLAELAPPGSAAADGPRVAAARAALTAAEEEPYDAPDVDIVRYWSVGEKKKEQIRATRDAKQRHDDEVANANVALDDAVYLRRAESARAALAGEADEPLPDLGHALMER